MRPNLVTLTDAARQLGVHKSTICRQVASGMIPNHGIAGAPLVDVEEARSVRESNLRMKQRGYKGDQALPSEGAIDRGDFLGALSAALQTQREIADIHATQITARFGEAAGAAARKAFTEMALAIFGDLVQRFVEHRDFPANAVRATGSPAADWR